MQFPGGYTISDTNILSSGSIGAIISKALPFIFGFAGIGLLLMIISSGFTIMMAAGDAKRTEAGKARLTNALVGFLLIFASFWIVQIVARVLGWDASSSLFGGDSSYFGPWH